MGKKKSKNKGKAPPRSSRTTSVAIAVCGLLVFSGLAYRFWPVAPPIPELDLASMEPQVAEKVEKHIEAVRRAPDSGEAFGRLAVVLQAHGLEAEASECYAQAIALEPGELRWEYLQVHALRSTEPEKALEQTVLALQVGDGYAPLHIIRAELLEERGESVLALEHFSKAVVLDPESAMAAFGAGRLLLSQGDIEKSLALLTRAAALDPDAGAIHASLAQVYRRRGDRDKAMAEAKLASERKSAVAITDPIHYRMRQESVSSIAELDRARAAVEAGDLANAESIYRGLVELRPDDTDMRARLGDVLAQQDRIAPAKREYLSALETSPDHASAHYGLANMLNLEGAYDEALEHYQSARSSRPDHLQTLVNLGSLLAFRDRGDEAEPIFEEALEIEPDAFGPHRQLGALLLKQKRWDEAIEHLSRALDARPDAGPVHFQLAVALASTGRFDVALSHARRAEELGQKLPPQFTARLKAGASGGSD